MVPNVPDIAFISLVTGARVYPVVHTSARDGLYSVRRSHIKLKLPRMLPTQSTGVCYYHASMCMIMNNHAFVDAYREHIRREIKASPCARATGEAQDDARKRRFSKKSVNLTMSRDFVYSTPVMHELFEAVRTREDLYLWSRNVLLLKSIEIAMDRESRRKAGSDAQDSVAFMAMKQWATMASLGSAFDDALKLVDGYWEMCCLHEIFSLSNLQVHVHGNQLVARVPGSGLGFVANRYSASEDDLDIDQLSCVTGLTLTMTEWAHAVAIVRNDKGFRIVDSNDILGTANKIDTMRARYGRDVDVLSLIDTYTCIMPDWPFLSRSYPLMCNDPPADGGSGGGGSGGPDPAFSVLTELEVLAVTDPAELTLCGEPQDEVSLALAIARYSAESQDGGAQWGSRAVMWSALAATILALAAMA